MTYFKESMVCLPSRNFDITWTIFRKFHNSTIFFQKAIYLTEVCFFKTIRKSKTKVTNIRYKTNILVYSFPNLIYHHILWKFNSARYNSGKLKNIFNTTYLIYYQRSNRKISGCCLVHYGDPTCCNMLLSISYRCRIF